MKNKESGDVEKNFKRFGVVNADWAKNGLTAWVVSSFSFLYYYFLFALDERLTALVQLNKTLSSSFVFVVVGGVLLHLFFIFFCSTTESSEVKK